MQTSPDASQPPRSPLVRGLALLGFVVACFSAAALGALFPPDEWYRSLAKPAWNPPGWVFGPVWTLLYLGMAVAAWRVWQLPDRRAPLGLFAAQLLLNAAWSPLFFGLHSPGAAFAEILCVLAAVIATGLAFYRRDRVAGLIFVPYVLWVSFASVLNGAIWWLNS